MSVLHSLRPWQYQVSGGFTVRGVYTEPSGKPVLHFIHGNGFCGLCYEELLAPLQDHVDIFISDAQGHGNSDAGANFAGWNRSAHYFAEVWRHFSPMWDGVTKIASGHSFGAVMSSVVMAKHPDLFDVGLLLDPTFAPALSGNTLSLLSQFGLTKHLPLAKQAAIRTTQWPDEEALWEYFYQRGVFKGWQDACLASYLKHAMRRDEEGRIHLKCPPRIEAAIFSSYPRWLWPALKSITAPCSILYGDDTFPFMLKTLPALQRANDRVSLIEMRGGHCFMQQHPTECAAKMVACLQDAAIINPA